MGVPCTLGCMQNVNGKVTDALNLYNCTTQLLIGTLDVIQNQGFMGLNLLMLLQKYQGLSEVKVGKA